MSTSPPSQPVPAAGGNARQVLVVDDDRFQLELSSELLKSLGRQEVTCVSSGPEALHQIASQPGSFGLILIDLFMPGMDGFQFMESLAQTDFKGALVIVSGQSDDVLHGATLVARLRRFTLLGTLAKPLERAALSALLSQA